MLDLLVEFERLPRGVSPNIEHYEVIDIGLPKKSRCGDLFGSMHFDSMTPQYGSAHLAGSLAAIDEKNFLAKNRAATKRWSIIHNPTSETRAPLGRGDSSGLCSRKEGKSTAIEKRCHTTLEMSPGCGFTMPKKRRVFSFAASLVSKDDSELEEGCGTVWGMGSVER